jgi:NADPH-dependent 2,4-dienoyl-CoA reductase/sulfur reductase-like enzyme
VVTGTAITAIKGAETELLVQESDDFHTRADIIVVATGVKPSTALAESAGVDKGVSGALRITQAMETNIPGIYAAGDCVETWHRLLDRPSYLPLGTTAHKQGRVAGENAVGGDAEFVGHRDAEVSKRIDVLATALFHEMTIDALSDLDLSYTPPLSSPWDPVQMAAQAWIRAR